VSSVSGITPVSQDLPDLALQVRAHLQASRRDRCNALHHDLDAGDALIKAQERVSSGWKRWLKDNCFLSVRTAMLYMRLARHREEIEAEIERAGDLSLRAAVRLISTPKKTEDTDGENNGEGNAPTPNSAGVKIARVMFDRLSPSEKVEFFHEVIPDTAALIAILETLPAKIRNELNTRVSGQTLSRLKALHPNARIKNLKSRDVVIPFPSRPDSAPLPH
jgi:hypothetical protein